MSVRPVNGCKPGNETVTSSPSDSLKTRARTSVLARDRHRDPTINRGAKDVPAIVIDVVPKDLDASGSVCLYFRRPPESLGEAWRYQVHTLGAS